MLSPGQRSPWHSTSIWHPAHSQHTDGAVLLVASAQGNLEQLCHLHAAARAVRTKALSTPCHTRPALLPLQSGLFADRSGVVHPGLAAYFKSNKFSDLTVLAPDGRRLRCHQVVLSAGSSRFAKLLEQGNMPHQEGAPLQGPSRGAAAASGALRSSWHTCRECLSPTALRCPSRSVPQAS
jgi:hypothetical protein